MFLLLHGRAAPVQWPLVGVMVMAEIKAGKGGYKPHFLTKSGVDVLVWMLKDKRWLLDRG